MKSVFEYTDYRRYLREYYDERKKVMPQFSYQYLADKAGFRTKTFLHKVMKGEKALSRDGTLKVADAIKLSKQETAFFEALVCFNEARSPKQRDYYRKRMQELAGHKDARRLRTAQFDYFGKWYHAVIRELATLFDWNDDYALLARTLSPPISPDEARGSVELLLEHGLLKKTGAGRYLQTDMAVTTGAYVTTAIVHDYQRAAMRLAEEALGRYRKEMRDISTLTVGISHTGFERIRDELTAFRERLARIVAEDEPADRVYQMNFQLFPVTATTMQE